ncbi:MAG: elongation factor G [Dehalococcoidia bacterium]|uniref:elongation factor G n=1 Tax=Candidatus Amarobacter glycogenicus TaxID=3140699 RepID=UPI003135EBF9|nr:elongation factor G [Dehalococcoidia bacterium]MBK9344720.1 elongation factor G [Dehalococcoidia bacterium]
MKVYATEDIRNVVLVGHGSVGKTMFAEAALYESGGSTRLGTIQDQNTVSDYDEDEHKRKFSLNLSIVPVEWEGRKINLIDTPGYADFISEVICGANAADLALVVVDAVSGPEVGTDRTWSITEKIGLPKMIVINRMDRENADFGNVLAQLQARWGHRVMPLQLPIGAHDSFRGIVDLLHMRAYTGEEAEETEVPADLAEQAATLRAQLIEGIVETDEELMTKYFADEELTEDELRKVLHGGLDHNLIIPVICASATKLIGVRQALHNIAFSGPSPLDRDPIAAGEKSLSADPKGAPAARVFKTSADPYVGRLTYMRVVTGVVKGDSHLWNANREADERLGTIYVQRGKEQTATPELQAGDIGVVAKLAHTETGDTLCAKELGARFEPIQFPSPVFSMAVHPTSKGAVDKLGTSLQRLVEEDPGLRLSRDQSSGEIILAGLGEAHLEVTMERLKRKFNIDVELTLPRVPYRETVSKKAHADYTHKKQTGGHGQYARVILDVEPLPRGAGLVFGEKVVGGSVPKEFIPAVEKGVHETAVHGVLAGYELTDCQVTLLDGKHHPVDSSEMAFKLAAAQALKEAIHGSGGTLLEPVMTIRVFAPEAHAGDVVSDLNTKRAKIHGINPDGGMSVVEAEVPLAEVQRYAADLRSITQGRGAFELDFDHYGEVPHQLAQKVIEEHKKAVEEAHAAH